MEVRLFKSNLDAFWGTTKNILTAVEGHPFLAIPLIIFGFIQNWTPLAAIILGVANSTPSLLIVGLSTYFLQYFSFFSVRRLIDSKPLKLLFFPLSPVIASCCIIRALIIRSQGSILWRGRKIKVTEKE